MPPSGSHGPRNALYGGDSLISPDDASDDAEASPSSDAFTSPKQEDLSERAVVYACSLPGRSAWASQADACYSALEQGATAAENAAARSTSSFPTSSWRGIKSKLPLPDDEEATGVILKIYDLAAAEGLQVSDVVDVVGILDRSSMPNAEWASSGAPSSSSSSSCPPAAQLHPALHVVLMERSEDVWSSSRSKKDAADLASSAAGLSVSGDVDQPTSARTSLISALSQHLHGDVFAAEWALLASIASIHTRKAPFSLGHLSLRLLMPASDSDDGSSDLESFLSSVLPSVAPLDVTLKDLNAAHVRLAPRASSNDADEGLGLLSGRLQLPKGTTLLVRESMSEGQLSSHGLENLQALQGVLKSQSLGYVFPYSPSPYALPVDLATIVVSEGAERPGGEGKGKRRAAATGGLVETDVEVAVQMGSRQADEGSSSTSGASLPSLRRHLLQSRRLARTLRVSESVAQSIQADFVSSRSSSRATSSQEDLLRRMDVARLVAASQLKDELSFEDYKRAKEMDEQRLVRLQERKEEVKRGAAQGAGPAAVSR